MSSGESRDTKRPEDKKGSREKSKIGHRRINDQGTVTYKKKTTSEIQKALQLGIKISVTLAHSKPKRDMLLKDFGVVETLAFPKGGSKETPTHDLSDFTFKTFAPIAFRYFRDFFQVDISDYLNSICHQDLRELSSAGASGSIFYITCDDEFIIKTVQHKEASFLQKLLPEYYINLIQHPRTLLPKFYGLYCYQTMGKNIRFVIMNNLLPSMIRIHEKYDLKGSTYKRMASLQERSKKSPILKDLDFRERHPDSMFLEVDTYEALLSTIQRDCRVLESFRIMDYSLLLGVHNIDENLRVNAAAADIESRRRDKILGRDGLGVERASQIHPGGVVEKRLTSRLDSIETQSESPPAVTRSAEEYFTPCGGGGSLAVSDGHLTSGAVGIVPTCDIRRQSGAMTMATTTSASMSISTMGTSATHHDHDHDHDHNHHNNDTNNNDHDNGGAGAGAGAGAGSSNKSVLPSPQTPPSSAPPPVVAAMTTGAAFSRQKTRSRSTRRIAAYSTVLESIHAPVEQVEMQGGDGEDDYIPTGGIPARNKGGDRLILYMGVIDILQSYQIGKKMEHNFKAIFLDASTISVTDPKFYAQRFQDFFANVVFRKIPSPMRQHPDRRHSTARKASLCPANQATPWRHQSMTAGPRWTTSQA